MTDDLEIPTDSKNPNNLKVLSDPKNHDNLLLAEAIAWLHDMGKCDERLLKKSALDYDNSEERYSYKKTHSPRVGARYLELPGEKRVLLKDLIEKGMPSSVKETNEPWLVRTLG